jgi:hypothetical protein
MNFAKIVQLCEKTKNETTAEGMQNLHRNIWDMGLQVQGRSATCTFSRGAFAVYNWGDKQGQPLLAVSNTISQKIESLYNEMKKSHFPKDETSTIRCMPFTFSNTPGTAYPSVTLKKELTKQKDPLCIVAKFIIWEKDGTVKSRFIDIVPCFTEDDIAYAYTSSDLPPRGELKQIL